MRKLSCFAFVLFSQISFASTLPSANNPCSIAGAEARRSENLLGALTQWPTPAFFVLDRGGSSRFVAPSKIFADVLNINEKSLIVNDVEELRFLSQTLAHSEILMVLKGKSDLNESKVKKVISVAKILDIKLSMVWLNDFPSPKPLKDLVSETGGRSFETRDLIQRSDDLCRESLAGG